MEIIPIIEDIVGKKNMVFAKTDDFYSRDWTGQYQSSPLVVVKPSSTLEVSKVVKACHQHKVPIVPISGNTGLAGGTSANNSVVISLERLNKIKEITVLTNKVGGSKSRKQRSRAKPWIITQFSLRSCFF